MKADIKDQARGKWVSILRNLGMPDHFFNGKHQPCPICEGKDRFRWNKHKESPYCSGCGIVTPMNLAMAWLNKDFKETTKAIRLIIGTCTMTETKPVDYSANEARIKQIHKGLRKLDGTDAASRYLAKRGLNVLPMKDCYFHPAIDYWDGKERSTHPTMVSIFRNLAGETCSYHITYLTPDGKKAEVEIQKKILPVIRELNGSAIKLFEPLEYLSIAEGIETALAVHAKYSSPSELFPVWAAGNANLMAKVDVPDSVKEVWIYADSDTSFTGQEAAFILAKRLRGKRKTVTVVTIVDGKLVEDRGSDTDFLDYWLIEQLEALTRN